MVPVMTMKVLNLKMLRTRGAEDWLDLDLMYHGLRRHSVVAESVVPAIAIL
jgi:hypothetical protein